MKGNPIFKKIRNGRIGYEQSLLTDVRIGPGSVPKVIMIVIVLLTFFFIGHAQVTNSIQPQSSPARAYTWYFGDFAGLDFSAGAPVALKNGALESFECTGTMSDMNGNLLFYTNGGDYPYPGGVWNRNNKLMPHGVTVGRGGCNSSEQGAMIVPLPRSESLYYLFTTDCMENNGVGGLRYSIVDMTADGGLGDVVVAAQKLISPTDESLAVIQHANGVDWWIVAHELQTDSFFVYQFNNHGIVGLVINKIGYVTPYWAGALKATTDGSKLIYAGLNWTSLFDFDTKTGIISNQIDLNLAGYTVAFSDNCRYAYVANGAGQQIYQYDLGTADVANTKTLVGSTTLAGFGGLAIGPDNKIYCSRFESSEYLGVINNPDVAGVACNYVDSGQYLGGRSEQGGLPNFPNTMLGGCVALGDEDSTPDTVTLNVDYYDSHSAIVSWTDTKYNAKYMVIYRQEGSSWSKIIASGGSATIQDLEPNTTYEVRVAPIPNDNVYYQPLTDHFLMDDMASANTTGAEETGSTAYLTTTQDFDFDLYPNPSNGGNTNIALNVGERNSKLTIRVTDMQGKVVDEQVINNVSGYTHYQLAINKLENGIYNIQVQTASNGCTRKLVILR